MKTKLMAKAKEIYAKHNFEILTVSKRFENKPLDGWDRGISCIQILKWIYGLDWEERVKVCITTQCGKCRILLSYFFTNYMHFRTFKEIMAKLISRKICQLRKFTRVRS